MAPCGGIIYIMSQFMRTASSGLVDSRFKVRCLHALCLMAPGAARAVVAWGQQQHGAGEAPRDEKPPPLCCVCAYGGNECQATCPAWP